MDAQNSEGYWMYRSSRLVCFQLLSLAGLAVAVVCLGFGCGDNNKRKKGEKKPEQSGRPELPCEKQGYPCTFKAVDKEVNRRTLELMSRVMLRAKQGANWKPALEWLRDQSSVAAATGSSKAIRFRLEAGRPAWVFLGPTGDGIVEPGASSDRKDALSGSTTRAMPVIAGDDRAPRDSKRALVLTAEPHISPGVTEKMRETLSKTRGYQSVEFRTAADGLRLSDFRNWGEFDFVYFLAHGGCDDEKCRHVAIFSGIFLDSPEALIPSDELESLDDMPVYTDSRWRSGAECGEGTGSQLTKDQQTEKEKYDKALGNVTAGLLEKSEHAETPGLSVIARTYCELKSNEGTGYTRRECQALPTFGWALEAPYFQSYSSDLEDTLVVANSCSLFSNRASDFAKVFGGDQRAFLGWSNVVTASEDNPVIPDLIDLVTERGVPAWTALKTLAREEGLTRTATIPDGWKKKYCDTNLSPPVLRHSEQRDTIRIREIISLRDPSGLPLEDGDLITSMMDGIAGDGQNDSLDVTVIVEGIDREAQTASSDPNSYELRLEWNGDKVDAKYNVGKNGRPSPNDHAYVVELEQVPLGQDIDPGEKHTLTAIVELPEGGTSKTEAEGLTVNTCWANYQAGNLEWNSESAEETDPYGGILLPPTQADKKDNKSLVDIGAPHGETRWLKSLAQRSVDKPGTYRAAFNLFEFKVAEYGSPEDETGEPIYGDLVVEEVLEWSSAIKIIRGTFEGPVAESADGPTHTLTGSFSLPAVRHPHTPSKWVAAWPDICGGDFLED